MLFVISVLMLPDEVLLVIMKLLSVEDTISLSAVNKRFYRLAHDRELWKEFCLNKDPHENESLRNIIARHCLHFEKLQYENQRGTLWNYFALSCIQSQLMLCKNVTEIILTDNLMIQSLKFATCMPKLKTIDLSGCNLLSSHELQYLYGHPGLKVVHLREFHELRHFRGFHFVVELTQKANIEELDIERSTYITPKTCKAIINGSHLKVLHFSPKWKRPPAWKIFNDTCQGIEFGLDFKAVLEFNVSGFRSSRLLELYNKAPFWATFDSEESEDGEN